MVFDPGVVKDNLGDVKNNVQMGFDIKMYYLKINLTISSVRICNNMSNKISYFFIIHIYIVILSENYLRFIMYSLKGSH